MPHKYAELLSSLSIPFFFLALALDRSLHNFLPHGPLVCVVLFPSRRPRFRVKGCYKGFSSMLLKEGLGNTVYFGSYEICKQVRVLAGGE